MKIDIGARIKARRKELGLTLKDVANALGASESLISRYESKDVKNMGIDKLPPLAKVLECTPAYLMGWDDNESQKEEINFTRQQEGFLYPFVSHCVAAGALSNIDAIANLETINLPDILMGRYAKNKNILIMQVNGESMNRIIAHGAFIAVKTDVEITDLHDSDVVVVANAGEYTVKRFYNDTVGQRFIFRPDSDSPSFTDIIFNYDNCDDLRLIGKVVMYNVFL